jgi:hypothetical protein
VLSDDYVRKWIAVQAGGVLKLEVRALMRGLRLLRDLAKARPSPDIADALDAAIASSRARQLDPPRVEGLRDRMQPLFEWERRRLPEPV